MAVAVFLLTSLLISTVNGWGPLGHAFVAQIAQSLLTNQSQEFVRNHLAWYTDGNMSMLSSWPDSILYPESNPVEYLNWQWSKELHYVDTPDWLCVYDRNRDCNWTSSIDGQRCVDGAIQNYTGRLANETLDDIQRQEALRFLVHFIGDAHQPLHAGFAGDRGGNDIDVTFCNKKSNLHKVWDTSLIEYDIQNISRGDINEYYNYLLNLLNTTYANNTAEWAKCPSEDEAEYLACSTAWIDESMNVNCAYVYRDEDNQSMNSTSETYHLCDNYFNSRKDLLRQRLLQAGVRLATVINKIVESQKQYPKHHKHHKQLSSGALFFAIITLLETLLLLFIIIYYLARRRPRRQRSANIRLDDYTYDTEKK